MLLITKNIKCFEIRINEITISKTIVIIFIIKVNVIVTILIIKIIIEKKEK